MATQMCEWCAERVASGLFYRLERLIHLCDRCEADVEEQDGEKPILVEF